MTEFVCDWWRAIQQEDYKKAAQFWLNTPKTLAYAFSSKFGNMPGFYVEQIVGDKSRSIYRIKKKGGDPILDVGYKYNDGFPGLVSPHSVTRAMISRDWFQWQYENMTFHVEDKKTFNDSVKYRIIDSAKRIISFTGGTVPHLNYYVPSKHTLEKFHAIESQATKKLSHRRWSWLDPFGGDIVSRDPTDIHELAHGFANNFDGWPPLTIREGFAECFCTTYDWKQWTTLNQYPELSRVWGSDPPPFVKGWYTASALLVAIIFIYLGRDNFHLFWNTLSPNAAIHDLANQLEMTIPELEYWYEAWCQKSRDFICKESMRGLLTWANSQEIKSWLIKYRKVNDADTLSFGHK